MSAAISFTPHHPQPFTLEQAMLLEIDTLVAEIARLENSIAHLQKTQDELKTYLSEEPEGDDGGELSEAMRENEGVIASQTERIALIKVALLNKIGEGGMRHYGLEGDGKAGAHAGTEAGAGRRVGTGGIARYAADHGVGIEENEPEEGHPGADDDGLYL